MRLHSLCGAYFRGIFNSQVGQRLHDLHCLQAHMHHLADEAEDVFGVIFAVGVVGDAAAFVGGDLVLIDDPLQRRAIP